MLKTGDQVTLNIGLPAGSAGAVTVTTATGTAVFSGLMSGTSVTFPASSLSTRKSGCYKLTVTYAGDVNYAPGQVGVTTVCVNFPLSAILSILLK